jgi:hypothetical protein
MAAVEQAESVREKPAARLRRAAAAQRAEGGAGNELVLVAATAVLKNLLENGMVDWGVSAHVGGDASVTALSPDRVQTGEDEKPQLNLFLYKVQPRGLAPLSRYTTESSGDGHGGRRLGSAPALDLFYLVTAYGAQDLQTEVLLGYAMEMLQENGLLENDEVRKILATISSVAGGRVVLPGLAALASSALMERIEEIKISTQTPDPEEIARLWSSLQARYRPFLTYKVAVALGGPGGQQER